jgi:hypothetical protein
MGADYIPLELLCKGSATLAVCLDLPAACWNGDDHRNIVIALTHPLR